MPFTSAQSLAINDRGSDLLVSASAGTGKTAVLIERVAGLIINDGIDIDRLLIVTFTEAAAAELKSRISSRLESVINQGGADVLRLSSQIEKIHSSDISTIHSFCKKLVLENYSDLGLDPEVKIADDSVQLSLIDDSIKEVISDKYSSGLSCLAISAFGDAYQNKALRKNIISIYSAAVSSSDVERFFSELRSNTERRFSPSDLKGLKGDIIARTVFELKKARIEALSLKGLAEDVSLDAYVSTSKNDIEDIEGLLTVCESCDYELIKSQILGFKFSRLKSIPKDIKEEFLESDLKKYRAYRNTYKNIITKLQNDYYSFEDSEITQEINDSKDIALSLIDMTYEFYKVYSKKKRLYGYIDFDDMQHFAYKVLSNPVSADFYKKSYDAIFVDEYQDTSKIQDDIISLIKTDGSLFIVGDYKQSIYGFRKAKPELFLEKYRTYSEKPKARAIELNDNFRSMPYVLDSVNIVFEKLMSEDFGGIDYKNTARLVSGRYPNGMGDCLGFSENRVRMKSRLSLIDKKAVKELSQKYDHKTEEELTYLSLIDRIKEIVKEEYPIFDEDGNVDYYKKYELSDICILMRSPNTRASWVKKIFEENGLSLSIDIDENLFDVVEISTLLDFIKVVSNPLDDIALLSVMRSPIGGFNDDELLILSSLEKVSYADLLDTGRIELPLDKKFSEGIISKLRALKSLISEFRTSDGMSIKSRLIRLIDITNYRYYCMGKRDSYTLYYALEDFIAFVDSFEQGSGGGLYDLLRYLEELRETNAKIKYVSKSKGDSGSVRLLSIHKSKGLQFPVVILFDAQKEFNPSHTDNIVFSEDGSLISKNIYRDKGLSYNNLFFRLEKQKKLDEQVLEEMRLLYVAMTRAEHRLEVFAKVDVADEILKSKLFSGEELMPLGRSYFNWISNSLGFYGLPYDDLDLIKGRVYQVAKTWCISVVDLDEIRIYKNEEPCPEDVEMTRFIEKAYPDFPASRRKSVTQIKAKEIRESDALNLSRKVFEKKGGRLKKSDNPTERGNAYHLFMKTFIDSGLDLESFIIINADNTYISETDMKHIDLEVIKDFCETDLYDRIKSSNKFWAEKPFVYKTEIDGEIFYVQGIIDLAFLEDDSLVVVDYKTDRNRSEEGLINLYRIQLEFYSKALADITGMPVKESLVYSFDLGKSIKV